MYTRIGIARDAYHKKDHRTRKGFPAFREQLGRDDAAYALQIFRLFRADGLVSYSPSWEPP